MDRNKVKKIASRIVIVLSIIVCLGIGLNWYLSRRLNSFLNKTLQEHVSEATDGFYTFSFDDFSVGFFNGELSIKGLRLKPDSAVFARWSAKDSLPGIYLDLKIASIDFKGLNFKWRLNYSKLHFDVFEIMSPEIKVYDIYNSRQYSYKTSKFQDKDLYELVSPYIDIVTVKKMNLENACISYTVEDSISSTVYKLDDASFHAYGFILDKNSSKSGKLLYCDNFDFSAIKPQTLLSNEQLKLTTNKIILDTKDSIILIDNVKLFSNQAYRQTEDFINAQIKTIAINGIDFKRINALTYLQTKSFNILTTDIYYSQLADRYDYSDKNNHNINYVKILEADSLLRHWSLYDITSPLLHSIIIDKITIGDASFRYTVRNQNDSDTYKLDNFDFEINKFKIDSVTNAVNRFKHADSFILNATGIEGCVPSKNHQFKIKSIKLNTIKQYFRIEDINLKSISATTNSDYLYSTVRSINFEGLKFQKGIDADLLEINYPIFRYSQKTFKKTQPNADKYDNDSLQSDVAELLSPFLNHLTVKKIRLNNADAVFSNQITNDKYSLHSFDFYATNFKINDTTRLTKNYFFSCDSFALKFTDFNNLSPDKNYRLKIKKGYLSGIHGRLHLEGVELIPQTTYISSNQPSLYFKTPLINISDITYDFNTPGRDKILNLGDIRLENPQIYYTSPKSQNGLHSNDNSVAKKQSPLFKLITIMSLDISYPYMRFSKDADESANIHLDKLSMKGLNLQPASLKMADLTLLKPKIQTQSSTLRANFQAEGLNLSGFEWHQGKDSELKLNNIILSSPSILYRNTLSNKETAERKQNQLTEDFYSTLSKKIADKITLSKVAVTDANINYLNEVNCDSLSLQKINKTQLEFANLNIDNKRKNIKFDNLLFETNNLRLPLPNEFYTIDINKLYLNQNDSILTIKGFNLIPAYSKMVFAHQHPKHKDWFDASVRDISISGIDFKRYFKDHELWINDIKISDPVLENFKNQQIEIEHNRMPLIYEGLQKSLIKFHVNNININNFNVTYEELAKKGTYPGLITFRPINGRIKGLSNIVQQKEQYTQIDADGIFMDNIPFTATWTIPVDSLNDKFFINAHINKFDLNQLNQIIIPLGGAEVKSGVADDVKFDIQASSKEAYIDMQFLYNNLEINILKDTEEGTYNKFVSSLANIIIRNNNPNNEKSSPRVSRQLHVKRDPYHSTFNYMWQILRPAAVEAVGISAQSQKLAGGFSQFFGKVKTFFSFGKKKKNDKKDVESTNSRNNSDTSK